MVEMQGNANKTNQVKKDLADLTRLASKPHG